MFRQLTINEVTALSDEERRKYLRTGYMFPISGGEGEGEGDDGGGNGDGDDDDDDDEDDEDVLEIKRSDYNALKEAAKNARKAEAAKEAAEKKAAEKARKDAGEYEELLKEKDEQIASLEAERDGVSHEFDKYKRDGMVKEQARQFGFKDPTDAIANLTDEDTEDENSVVRGLRRVARAKPYLVDPRKASAAPLNGTNGEGATGGLTMEQIKNMSTEEIGARMEEVQAAMAASKQ